MKRALLLALLLLAGGASAGLWLLRDPGYILLSWQHTSVEMSLTLGLLLWLGSCLLLSLSLDLIWRLLGLGNWWLRWRQSRDAERSARAFRAGTVALELGEYKRAERLLFSAARLAPEPLPAWLAAARAASQAQAFARAEQYLVLAEERSNSLAVSVARARLLLGSGRWEQAADYLRRRREHIPEHRLLLQLEMEVLLHLQRWDALAALLPALDKHAPDAPHFAAIEKRAHRELLAWTALRGGRIDRQACARQLQAYWERLPKRLRHDNELLADYCRELLHAGADDKAEALLREALQQQWSHGLVELYGRCRSLRPDRALALAETWAATHGHNPALMLALGRLCLQNRRWHEARQYFESSLSLRKSPEAYAELIRLLSHMDEPAARHYLLESLGAQNERLPDLPLPPTPTGPH